MERWLIIIGALWLFPVIAIIAIRKCWPNKAIIKRLLGIFTISSVVVIACMSLGISTSFSALNWIAFCSIYLTINLWLCTGCKHPNKWVKTPIKILTLIICAVGYLAGSIGVLGIGLVVGGYEPVAQQKVTSHIIYREYSLGNALTEGRGSRMSLYRTYFWLPFIEYEFFTKDAYYDVTEIIKQQQLNAANPASKSSEGMFNVIYNKQKKVVLLKSRFGNHNTDTIRLE